MAVLRIQVLSGPYADVVAGRLREHDSTGMLAVTVGDQPATDGYTRAKTAFFDRVQAEYEQIAPRHDSQPGPTTTHEPMPDRDGAEPA